MSDFPSTLLLLSKCFRIPLPRNLKLQQDHQKTLTLAVRVFSKVGRIGLLREVSMCSQGSTPYKAHKPSKYICYNSLKAYKETYVFNSSSIYRLYDNSHNTFLIRLRGQPEQAFPLYPRRYPPCLEILQPSRTSPRKSGE